MTKKTKITEDNYKEIVLRKAILICWILLFLFFVIKIFGGNFFEIICNSQQFIMVCNYIDNNQWLQIIIGCLSSYITLSLFWLSICRKYWFTKTELIMVIISVPLSVIFRMINSYLDFIMNIIMLMVLPFVFKRGKKAKLLNWFIPLLIYGNIANIVFQLISAFVKNLMIKVLVDNFLIAIIFAIDVYIMLFLYYLYSNTERRSKMSWLFSWLLGKSESQLRNMKANRLAKIEKLQEEIKAIEDEMEKQKNESKN